MQLWEATIWGSAYRHGFSETAIRHALRNFTATAEDSDDVTLFLGPADASGHELIEVGVLSTDKGSVVIHAMKARITRFHQRKR